MSIHLLQCAAQLRLKPGEKLVLLCLAENANSRDARAFPGLPALMTWSGLSKSHVLAILKTLGELRLIEQVKRGHRGQAAEFTVFPYGCCTIHGAGLYGSAGPDASEQVNESGVPDPAEAGEGSGRQDPAATCGQSGQADPVREKGSEAVEERVRSHADRMGPADRTPTKNYPQNTTPRLSSTSVSSPETVVLHDDSDVVELQRATA